ncbi:MAG TPA: ferrochelatase [Terriglobales bacterium]|nr:ferrochelatase [Terriglobales bacterium]
MSKLVGVVVFQLGGPDSLDAIEPFLYNLFCDPDIIDFPFARLGRKPLARLISTTRAHKVQHHYEVIGGGSPIRKFTEQQARALEKSLADLGIDARCFVAMRYWHPLTQEAAAAVERAGCDELILLPLYPQYSSTTTGSSLNEWRRHYRHPEIPVHVVSDFYREELYLKSLVENIDESLDRFAVAEKVELVFSAHSVPVAVVQKGDPYQHQIEETVELLMARGGWNNRHRLCYQSKVGASKWLQPSLRQTLRELASAGVNDVCVIPVSFVSDHVETLGEIDHEARQLAMQLGIRQFEMTAGLNDSPTFIAALAELVVSAIGADRQVGKSLESLLAAD